MEQKRRNSMSKFFHPHLSRRKKQIKEKKRSYCQNATALPSHTAVRSRRRRSPPHCCYSFIFF